MTVVLALASALMYGLSDFIGGLLSRRASVWSIATVGQATAAFCTAIFALLLAGRPTVMDVAWGVFAGVGTGTGAAFLYRGLSTGRMGVVAPLSGIGAAALPVIVGVAAGERPGLVTWCGMGLALPAIWLVSASAEPADSARRGSRLGAGVVDGLLAGAGFGVLFAALGQVPDRAGLGPVAVAQVVSVLVVILLATGLRERWLPRDPYPLRAAAAGALGATATALFLLATQSGLLAVAAVLSSLYPAFTVLLAVMMLREHIHRNQAVGLAMAAAAVSLVAIG